MPVRYRHSIGSPSLLHHHAVDSSGTEETQSPSFGTEETEIPSSHRAEETVIPSFGAEETERYFSELINNSTEVRPIEEVEEVHNIPHDMQAAYDEYINRDKKRNTLLVQRDDRYFWKLIFKQNFDLASDEIKVRFAGEAATDDGGPLKEFLTLSMKRFKDTNLCFGFKECAFRNFPDDPENRFFKLGQITGLSILLLNRGPECLHPAVVRTLFDKEQPEIIESIDDGLIVSKIEEIKSASYDDLYKHNINPIGKTTEELIRLYQISVLINANFFTIHKFRSGIISVSQNILNVKNYEEIKKYLEYGATIEYTFEDFIKLIVYPQATNIDADEANSNYLDRLRNAISEFELFLLEVGNQIVHLDGELKLKFTDILLLLTGSDRIPLGGFEKKIEVFFTDDVSIPKISTCGLMFTLPLKMENFAKLMVNSVKFGGVGFGDI